MSQRLTDVARIKALKKGKSLFRVRQPLFPQPCDVYFLHPGSFS